jgi:hypothetical protein
MKPRWKVRFETPLDRERGEFSTKFQDDIVKNFENRLSLGEGARLVAIEYEVEGDKSNGYRLTAVVTYDRESEIHPEAIFISKRWKVVFDRKEWEGRLRRRARIMEVERSEEEEE